MSPSRARPLARRCARARLRLLRRPARPPSRKPSLSRASQQRRSGPRNGHRIVRSPGSGWSGTWPRAGSIAACRTASASTSRMPRSTKPERKPRLMSRLGAPELISRADDGPAQARIAAPLRRQSFPWAYMAPRSAAGDEFFLPDFCAPRMALVVVLICELLAAVLTLARPTESSLLMELARISLFVQWLGLSGAALLCYTRPRLVRLSVA